MKGSWAGAMGQTQFMPSSFLAYAVDFEGNGRRDIWDSAPDAIGSTANFLASHGWIAGAPWGFEVRLPEGFKLTAADSSHFAPFAAFAARGVARADGGDLPHDGEAALLIPAGLKGPIFLVTANFRTIKTYNNSTAYALGVALLGDAVMGRDGVKAAWPTRDKPLAEAEVRAMQRELDAARLRGRRHRRPGRRPSAGGAARLPGVDRRRAGRLSDPRPAAPAARRAIDRACVPRRFSAKFAPSLEAAFPAPQSTMVLAFNRPFAKRALGLAAVAALGVALAAPSAPAQEGGLRRLFPAVLRRPAAEAARAAGKPKKKVRDFVPATTTREPGTPGGAAVQPTFFIDVLGDSLAVADRRAA